MREANTGGSVDQMGMFRRRVLPALAVVALVAACSGGGSEDGSSEAADDWATFTFDDLGGGPETILVYQGPGESEADRQVASDEYDDGDQAFIDCVVPEGREVPSDPSVGEREETSHVWFRLLVPGYPFATDTYGDADTAIDDISECDPDVLPTAA